MLDCIVFGDCSGVFGVGKSEGKLQCSDRGPSLVTAYEDKG